MISIEQFLDEIANALITNIDTLSGGGDLNNKEFLRKHQKTVRDGIAQRMIDDNDKTLTLPNGVKAIIDFKGIKFKASKGAPVFLDRDELLKFFRGSTKYLRYT